MKYDINSPQPWELIVYLDGKKIDKVIEADTDKGEITRYTSDFIIVDDELLTEKLYGVVTVVREAEC